jgi:hypothetical protein
MDGYMDLRPALSLVTLVEQNRVYLPNLPERTQQV